VTVAEIFLELFQYDRTTEVVLGSADGLPGHYSIELVRRIRDNGTVVCAIEPYGHYDESRG
jgi:hypothetical protein